MVYKFIDFFERFNWKGNVCIISKVVHHRMGYSTMNQQYSKLMSQKNKYHTIDQLNKINIAKHGEKLSFMHLNISSLLYHFNELSELLNDLIIKFKIIGITESRLRSEKSPLSWRCCLWKLNMLYLWPPCPIYDLCQ